MTFRVKMFHNKVEAPKMAATHITATLIFLLLMLHNASFYVLECSSGRSNAVRINFYSRTDFFIAPYWFTTKFSRVQYLRSGRNRIITTWFKHGYLCIHKADHDHVFDLTIHMDIHSNPGPTTCIPASQFQFHQRRNSQVNDSTTMLKYSRSTLMSLRRNGITDSVLLRSLKVSPVFKYRGKRAGKNFHNRKIVTLITDRREYSNYSYFGKLLGSKNQNYANLNNLICVNARSSNLEKIHTCLDFCLLNSRSVRNKTLILKDFVVENDIDICAFTETWLRPNQDDMIIGDLCPTSYNFIHVPREHTTGGGVGLLFRDSLNIKNISQHNFKSFEYIELFFHGLENIRIIVIYRPPPSSSTNITASLFFDDFARLLERIIGIPEKLLIVGDFNFHLDDLSNSLTKQFFNLLDCFELKQHVLQPTHNSGHTLDLVITRSEEPLVKNISVSNQPISDHSAVLFNVHVEKPLPKRKILSFRKLQNVNIDHFKADLKNSTLFDDTTDLELLLCRYEHVLSSTLDLHAPIIERTITIRPKAPWFTPEISARKREKRKLERKWRNTGLLTDKQCYTRECFIINNMISSAKQEYYASLIKDNKSNLKVLFSTVKTLLQKKKDIIYPSHSDRVTLVNTFADYFTSKVDRIQHEVMEETRNISLSDLEITESCPSSFINFKLLTVEEVSHLIIRGNLKSCSLDPLPASLLKNCYEFLLPALTKIVNLSLGSGTVPDSLKAAALTPLLKKPNANHEDMSNFRPISNLKFVSKLIEKAVALQLNEYITKNNLHESFQSAYKTYHSTESALLRVQNDILRSVDKDECVILVFLDMSAAFDTVDHDILLSRLSSRFGLSGCVLDWFRSYLSSRKQFVSINGCSSSYRDLDRGVPQGSVLGPILYLLYTSPLSDIIKRHGLNYHFFADDSQLYLAFKRNNPREASSCKLSIQECIDDIYKWLLFNKLKLNQSKTELLLIHSKFKPAPPFDSLQIGGNNITPSSSATNLGVIFDQHLSLEKQVNKISKSSYYQLRNLSQIRKYLTIETTQTIVHAFISSKLDYCNSLLYGSPKYLISKLQYIQNTAARLVTFTKRNEHITPVLVHLHWLPVEHRIVFKLLLIVYKSLHGRAPIYLSELLHYRTSSYSLRSIENKFLELPKAKLKSYGDRAFQVAAPKLWNDLPLDLRNSSCLDFFKHDLKTHLFKRFISQTF